MNKDIFTYLKTYSFDPMEIDRLIVSSFLYSMDLKDRCNEFIQPYIINDRDNDYLSLKEFISIHTFSNIEELINVFEFVISPQEKVITGAVYTPESIREYIINQCFSEVTDFNNITICDPACGCAGFLYTAAKLINRETGRTYREIFSQNLYGVDIQEYSIARSKILLTLLALCNEDEQQAYDFNLYQGNALNFDWSSHISNHNGFDIVVGNPPYVCSRNIDEESKKYIFDWKVSTTGHPDLYIPFFQIGIESLKPKGILGFIAMNTFFKSVNGRALRQYFEDEALNLKIIDFGGNQIFESKSTYTCICFVQKRDAQGVEYVRGSEKLLDEHINFEFIPYTLLNHKNGWSLQHHELLRKIEKTGQAFGDLYRTRNGIATLKNNIYIFRPIDEDEEFYYLQNGAIFPIEKGICKEVINPNKLTQHKSVEELIHKVIFPYSIDKSGNAQVLEEVTFRNQYPAAFNYLETKRNVLATRDKGKGKYGKWYAYGRNQSLERYKSKLFFPHITPHIPNYTLSNNEELLFYNGIAVVSDNEQELRFLKKLMSSNLFWFYVVHSSKPYGSGYFSLSRNYIKSFGVYQFTDKEKDFIINANMNEVNEIIENHYDIDLPEIILMENE